MTSLQKINSLIGYLPENDRKIALKLIERRDFDSLKELVDSCMSIAKRKFMSNSDDRMVPIPPELFDLQAEVTSYVLFLNGSEEGDEEEDCDE